MGPVVYFLGTLTTLLCAVLLVRAYVQGRVKLLLWSGLCFVGLTLSNILVFIDLVILPVAIDLYLARLFTASVAMLLLLYGLVWESE